MHGEGRKFVSALITLDPEMIVEWGDEHGLRRPDAGAAGQGAGRRTQMIQEHVDTLNGQLERWETVKKFVILPTTT